MVLRDVEHGGGGWLEVVHAVELEAGQLDAPTPVAGGAHRTRVDAPPACPAASGRCCRPRPPSCRRAPPAGPPARHGGLAVGAGDSQHRRRIGCPPSGPPVPGQTGPARRSPTGRHSTRSVHQGATSAGDRPGLRNTARMFRAFHQRRRESTADKLCLRQLFAQRAQLRRCVARVGHRDLRALQRAHQRAIARPDAPRPRMRTCWSLSWFITCSFNVDRPTRHSSMVMIQKRTTTCVSFQPLFSKWWCSGAIFRMRRPSPYFSWCT
jgi:hypothetical protein